MKNNNAPIHENIMQLKSGTHPVCCLIMPTKTGAKANAKITSTLKKIVTFSTPWASKKSETNEYLAGGTKDTRIPYKIQKPKRIKMDKEKAAITNVIVPNTILNPKCDSNRIFFLENVSEKTPANKLKAITGK